MHPLGDDLRKQRPAHWALSGGSSRARDAWYAITRRLKQLGFADVVEGTIYTILLRLERNGLVQVTKRPSGPGATAHSGDPGTARG